MSEINGFTYQEWFFSGEGHSVDGKMVWTCGPRPYTVSLSFGSDNVLSTSRNGNGISVFKNHSPGNDSGTGHCSMGEGLDEKNYKDFFALSGAINIFGFKPDFENWTAENWEKVKSYLHIIKSVRKPDIKITGISDFIWGSLVARWYDTEHLKDGLYQPGWRFYAPRLNTSVSGILAIGGPSCRNITPDALVIIACYDLDPDPSAWSDKDKKEFADAFEIVRKTQQDEYDNNCKTWRFQSLA